MTTTVESAAPIPDSRLTEIAKESCEKAFGTSTEYDHTQAGTWNTAIIEHILNSLVSANTGSSDSSTKHYKYAVTSTVIQHITPSNSTTTTGTSTDETPTTEATNGDVSTTEMKPTSGRRGMHSASGAYWNNETDGMWNFKWEEGEKRGCDVVISVIWIQA